MLLGRRTFELTRQAGAPPWPKDWRIFVFSRTLDPSEYHGVTVVSGDSSRTVTALRAEGGRDIWLFGGGQLLGSLVAANLVDDIEVAVMPVLLGGGVRLAGAAPRSPLKLIDSSTSPSGVVHLRYAIGR